MLGDGSLTKSKEAAVDGMDMSKINQNIIDSVVLSAYEMNDENILDVLDNIATGTGILGGTTLQEKLPLMLQLILLLRKQQAEDLSQSPSKQQKQQIGNIFQDGIQQLLVLVQDKKVQLKHIVNAIVELSKIGTPEAFTKQTALMNFYDKMVEEGADERNVDDAAYAFIQTNKRNRRCSRGIRLTNRCNATMTN